MRKTIRISGIGSILNDRTRMTGSSLVLIAMIVPGLTFADWNFHPVIRAAADFDDNASMTARTDEIDSISGLIGEASLGIAYDSDTNIFFIEPIFRSRSYDSDFDRDSNDQFLNFRMRHNGKSSTLSMHGNYGRESVRTAEIADASLDADVDPDEIEDDDSARVDLDLRREKFRIVPRWSYRVSDVSEIIADINYVTVDFDTDTQAAIGLVDYTDVRARLAYTRNFSDRNKAVLVGTFRNYETGLVAEDFSGYGISAGFDRELTQTSTIRALIGLERTEQFMSQDEPHLITDFSFVRRQETTRFLAQFRRRVSASGRGTLSLRNEFNLRFTRDLTEKFSAGLGARAYETETVGSGAALTNYVQLHAQLLWQFTPAFSMQSNYRHTVVDRSIVGESANSNRFTLWFSYHPNSRNKIQIRP